MKKLSVLFLFFCLLLCKAKGQDNDGIYMGQITVYSFKMDSISYTIDGEKVKKYSAIGTESVADLYSIKVGNETFFKIQIDGNSYAVINNPYGSKVSDESYYGAWLDKGRVYAHLPTLNHKAGPFFLTLPYKINGNDADKKLGIAVDASDKKQEQNKFVGVWKSTEREHGDIQISLKDDKLFVQMKTPDGLQSEYAKGDDDFIEWSIDVNVEYGEWRVGIYQTGVGQVIVGGGYSYTAKRKPKGGVSRESSFANKEVLRRCYRARIKDGNLIISVYYKYLYYYDNRFCFYCEGDYAINNIIYTQW